MVANLHRITATCGRTNRRLRWKRKVGNKSFSRAHPPMIPFDHRLPLQCHTCYYFYYYILENVEKVRAIWISRELRWGCKNSKTEILFCLNKNEGICLSLQILAPKAAIECIVRTARLTDMWTIDPLSSANRSPMITLSAPNWGRLAYGVQSR